MGKYEHLWISDGDVMKIENKPTGRDKEIPVDFSDHGIKLISELNTIEKVHSKKDTSVSSKYFIFKTVLHKSQKYSRKKRQEFLQNNGLEIKYIKSNNEAIVATEPGKFNILKKKVEGYQSRNKNLGFRYIDSFNFINRSEKQSEYLRKIVDDDQEEKIDIQIQLLPNFSENTYKQTIEYINKIIIDSNGEIQEEPYYLTDKTPVMRALINSSTIDILSDDDMIFRIEQTNFFQIDSTQSNNRDFDQIKISDDIDFDGLPVVGILDSAVDFGESALNDFLIERWSPDDIANTSTYHGTGCAACAMFADTLNEQIELGELKPRVKIVNGVISDGKKSVSFNKFINRIKDAVTHLKQYTSIFNLSFNSNVPIDDYSISILAYELDNLMKQEDVQFIISSGNHKLYRIYDNLNDVIDDDESRLSSPADSFLGLTVGSYCSENILQSISGKNEIAPFSRIGFGLGGIQKPDIVAFGGNIHYDSKNKIDIVPDDDSSLIPTINGEICHDCGTSYATPIITGDFAIIKNKIPDNIPNRNILSKALLIQNSDYLFDISDLALDEKELLRKVYGNGVLNLNDALESNDNKVTFVRVGSLNYYTKKRVKFYMPSNLAEEEGIRTCRVKVTCVSDIPFKKDKGTGYSQAYISASLKKIDTKEQLSLGNPTPSEGRYKWDVYQTFSNTFSQFNPGDWQIWLQMSIRWDLEDDFPLNYALVVTIEDLNKNNNIYTAIQQEVPNRYKALNEVRIRY